MSKECKIVEDLLPLFHDGICSQESRQMVEKHLSGCENCKRLLTQMEGELIPPSDKDADMKPLEGINKAVKKGKKRALIVGISIALAVVFVLFGGISIWWYAWEYTYYIPFAEGREPHSIHWFDEDGNIGASFVEDASKFTWYDDTYRYDVEFPGFLSGNGRVEMTRLDNTEDEHISVYVSRLEGTKYVFHVSFAGDSHTWIDEGGGKHWAYFMVDSEMNLYYLDHWTEDYRQGLEAKFEEYKDEVRTLVYEAMAMWPFLK